MNDSSLSIATSALPPAYSRGEGAGARARLPAVAADRTVTAPTDERAVQPATGQPMGGGGNAQAASDLANIRTVPAGQEAQQALNGQPQNGQAAKAQNGAEKGQLSRDELDQAVESINSFLQSSKRSLEFSVDDSSGRTIIKVMDAEKEKVIRQIPPESVLELISEFRDGNGIAATGLMEKA